MSDAKETAESVPVVVLNLVHTMSPGMYEVEAAELQWVVALAAALLASGVGIHELMQRMHSPGTTE